MRRAFLCVFPGVMFLAGCSTPSADEYLARAEQAELKARAVVDTLRDQRQLPALFTPVLENYQALVDKYPASPLAARALFAIATIQQGALDQPQNAIATYTRYAALYPDSAKAETALFIVGYMYNNVLQNLDSARAAYTRFLVKYPNSELALSAQAELQNLGKAPEEMLPPAVKPDPPATATRKTAKR
jgi:tetratricopeptide (TPR) repeat protein